MHPTSQQYYIQSSYTSSDPYTGGGAPCEIMCRAGKSSVSGVHRSTRGEADPKLPRSQQLETMH